MVGHETMATKNVQEAPVRASAARAVRVDPLRVSALPGLPVPAGEDGRSRTAEIGCLK